MSLVAVTTKQKKIKYNSIALLQQKKFFVCRANRGLKLYRKRTNEIAKCVLVEIIVVEKIIKIVVALKRGLDRSQLAQQSGYFVHVQVLVVLLPYIAFEWCLLYACWGH